MATLEDEITRRLAVTCILEICLRAESLDGIDARHEAMKSNGDKK